MHFACARPHWVTGEPGTVDAEAVWSIPALAYVGGDGQGPRSDPLQPVCSLQERYVKEVESDKENIILINKADLLNEEQRAAWAQFFESEGVKVVFWSALGERVRLSTAAKVKEVTSLC